MSFLHTYARYPLQIETGEGCRLRATDGRWYLDGIAGIAVMALGHGHPAVKTAVHAQVDALMHVSNLYSVGVQTELAALLSRTFGGGSVFFTNSGSEANETAIKLVRKYHSRRGDPRHEVVVLEHAFHGRTLMALSMTPKPRYQEGMGPMADGVVVCRAEDAAAAVGPRTAAVVVEPVQGEGGCRPVEVLPELRAACDAHGALLVYDEIQCGLGRTGSLHHDPEPDIRTLAKALGGGLPLGAVVAGPHLADTFQPGDHGSTFGGNPVACAAGLATLRTILDEGLVERCKVAGARLRAGLESTGVEVRGVGLMLAAVVGEAAPAVVTAMRERGVLVCPAGPDAIRFLPPYVISDAEIDELVTAFAGAWDEAGSS
ncbi:MAG: aminotransferase class III-fold pyridoxal phosphate-dependent enzyme [Deltaproteobacteria bacterium]|nr:MAG: aminotransferase class III-fold pyridoxal phosphate-dependent enzyme [Deltaproteobacteria bacterium]